eukprot:scaffold9899_cov16-Tisochrysis_lutea.AAC.1
MPLHYACLQSYMLLSKVDPRRCGHACLSQQVKHAPKLSCAAILLSQPEPALSAKPCLLACCTSGAPFSAKFHF